VARSGEEIQHALLAFARKWVGYTGTERAEAQSFLNELFAAYGTDRQAVGAKFEDFKSSAGFMDLHWPGLCIVEMKAPNVDLTAAREQVLRYWHESEDADKDIPKARFVIVCNFRRFEVWEPGLFESRPRAVLALEDLPDRNDVLGFLAGPSVEPVFVEHHRELTTKAAEKVAVAYHAMADRSAAPIDELQRFLMQSVWCMFAEDLQMLRDYPFQKIVRRLIAEPHRSSSAELGQLFRVLNRKGDHLRQGVLAGTTYVNGELFAHPAEVDLDAFELSLLDEASRFDWRLVNPTIFGSLMESVLEHDRRWELGAHYTHETDIMKIVTPTIVRPWRERIDAAASPDEARALLDELCAFKVLDPACGCGNFLYVAYRELRGLEALLKQRIVELARERGLPVPTGPFPYVPVSNMQGIDIELTAVMIARVTLWMGHRQMIDLYGAAEDPLPLVDLSGIRRDDALRVPWPETDCIIGNPPFLGSQHLRGAIGSDYVEWLKREFGVGVKDFCVYWFRRAVDHLQPAQRAGLVGTNSVSQNRARSASLQYVVDSGGVITDAVSSQKWPGEAHVHVSLVNWVMDPDEPPKPFTIDGVDVEGIGPDLRETAVGAWTPVVLEANKGRCFQGPIPVGAGFIVSADEAQELLARSDADYRQVVRPYLTGEDIADRSDQSPGRWIVDLASRSLEEAMAFPAALQIVRERVKPERERNARKARRERWWLHGEQAVGMRTAIVPLARFITSNRVGKRLLMSWQASKVLPSDKAQVFAFDDDFAMGVLTSCGHGRWAWHTGGTLKGDLAYTPTSVFMTFPWPDTASPEQRERAADACRRLLARRSEICLSEQIGLTTLYNAVDEGAYTDLTALHSDLDEAVADCYGWPRAVAQDDRELVRRLTELNRAIATGERPYSPFAHLDE